MKAALVFLALVGLSLAAPQPRKIFHEHFKDFMDLIGEESGAAIENILEHYSAYDEYNAAMDYLRTNNFKNLVKEMEALPEFAAVVDFLENDNIDIHFFIDLINDMLEIKKTSRSVARHDTSGTDFTSFIEDSIALFPKEKLAALYEQKIAEDEEFNAAMTNMFSDEWKAVFTALWENEVFLTEVQTLNDNGINIYAVLHEIVAIFGF